MEKYVKPVVVVNEECAEGVYAASGDCWSVSVVRDQEDAGGYTTYRVVCNHNDNLQHLSVATEVNVYFGTAIAKAEYEDFEVSVSGNTVTLTRESLGNSYLSGDNFNSLLKVWTVDGSVAEANPSATIVCTKTVNVQGNGGDGN